jgi:hypothetical protein
MRVLISYARTDYPKVAILGDRLTRAGYQVWIDGFLEGGEVWWDDILARIREADAFITVVSRSSLKSNSVQLQRHYATQLGLPIVPVAVEPLNFTMLPAGIAGLEIIDCSQLNDVTAARLTRAIAALPPPGPLPVPLPLPPALPTSHWTADIADQLGAPALGLTQQLALIERIEAALDEDPARRPIALELLNQLAERPDLSAVTAQRIATFRQQANSEPRPAEPTENGWQSPYPPPRPPKIFLCYRREDTQGFARSIYDRLADKYGEEQVFRDVDSTPAGVKFSAWIESKVGQCDVMIVLIGPLWLQQDATGNRRLDSPKDWVRQEIETALRRNIPIIPVRLQGAPMPSADSLPDAIADLTEFQSAEMTDSRWSFDLGELIRAVENLIAP